MNEVVINVTNTMPEFVADIVATGAKGDTGAAGINGADGKTAYESAIDGGFIGTEEEFNMALKDVKNKVDKVAGKGLSTEDYTTTEKSKLSGIAEGAQVNSPIDSALSDTSENPVQNKAVNAALDEKANIAQEAWITPTLLNAWTTDGVSTGNAIYRKDGMGNVWFLIIAKSGTITDYTTIMIFPSGYRPNGSTVIYAIDGNVRYTKACYITASGELRLGGTQSFVSGNVYFISGSFSAA